jgi:hypothetical protein
MEKCREQLCWLMKISQTIRHKIALTPQSQNHSHDLAELAMIDNEIRRIMDEHNVSVYVSDRWV